MEPFRGSIMPDGVSSRNIIEGVGYGDSISGGTSDPAEIPFISIDASLCEGCGKCVSHCDISAIARDRTGKTCINPVVCINCGQCIKHCENGAIIETVSSLTLLETILGDPGKHSVALLSPAAAKTLADSFSCRGPIPHGRIVHALRGIGFKSVWDIETGADAAISAEAENLIARINRGDTGTVFTSFCPAFEKYAQVSSIRKHSTVSDTKTPLAFTAAAARKEYAHKMNIPPADVITVAVMPCVAKKYESLLPRNRSDGKPDTDIVLTVRELAHLLKQRGIDLSSSTEHDEDHRPEHMRKESTRFTKCHGVMDSILTTLSLKLGEEKTPRLRGNEKSDGIRSAVISINDTKVRVAVARGMRAAGILNAEAAQIGSPYNLIEVLACPGGCVNGGGCTVRRGIIISAKRAFRKFARRLFPSKHPGECA